jgi:hypothetical protein
VRQPERACARAPRDTSLSLRTRREQADSTERRARREEERVRDSEDAAAWWAQEKAGATRMKCVCGGSNCVLVSLAQQRLARRQSGCSKDSSEAGDLAPRRQEFARARARSASAADARRGARLASFWHTRTNLLWQDAAVAATLGASLLYAFTVLHGARRASVAAAEARAAAASADAAAPT